MGSSMCAARPPFHHHRSISLAAHSYLAPSLPPSLPRSPYFRLSFVKETRRSALRCAACAAFRSSLFSVLSLMQMESPISLSLSLSLFRRRDHHINFRLPFLRIASCILSPSLSLYSSFGRATPLQINRKRKPRVSIPESRAATHAHGQLI